MTTFMGVREFREKFTALAREAEGTIVVTNHDKVVGYYTPSAAPPADVATWFADFEARAAAARAEAEARGIDVAARLAELGLDE